MGVKEGGRGGGGDRHTRHVQVQALVEKRTLNLDYIRRVHDGEERKGKDGGDGKGNVAIGQEECEHPERLLKPAAELRRLECRSCRRMIV